MLEREDNLRRKDKNMGMVMDGRDRKKGRNKKNERKRESGWRIDVLWRRGREKGMKGR